ncbi:DUF7619 domain-containing protein [Flavobacterium enshiense]|uniref:T9SS type A sorting domain-containing protein n=1 Tax=Flavobacterium enshiense TaxID=1341165 RepID=UPI00345DA301
MEIDTNHDMEIQVSEALNVYKLDLSEPYDGWYPIDNLSGIENFTNLTHLFCFRNSIESFDARPLVNLRELNIGENYTQNLIVAGLSNLKALNCYHFTDDFLDLTGLVNLETLDCSENDVMTTLNLTPCINLKNLTATSVDRIANMTITGLNNLVNISFNGTGLQHFTVTNLPSLKKLYCVGLGYTLLTNLQLASLPNLEELYCNANRIASLNLSGMNRLRILECQDNRMTGNLYLSDKLNLITAKCSDNLLTGLFLKNGHTWGTYDVTFYDNPNLRYICVEESQIPFFRNKVYQSGMSNSVVEVNSYCSFTPAGVYYTLQGDVKYDLDGNGCDVNDIKIPNANLKITYGVSDGFITTNQTGNYAISVNEGAYVVTPNIELYPYFNVAPSVVNVSFPSQSSPVAQDFCITANGVHSDLEVLMLPISPARPGFTSKYKIVYKNKGTGTQSGSVNLMYNNAVLGLLSTNPVYTTSTTNSISWDFVNLKPSESKAIELTIRINSPMDTPAVNGGDVLNFTASISSTATDETPADNTFVFNQRIVNSYDPNDKTCLQGTTIAPSAVGKYVHYMIRFENTGTFSAENIVVKDVIDATKFDVNSLVPISGSHNYYTKISGDKVEFIFENINLPFDDANNDGFVAFKIKTKPTLVTGNTFSNTASIYFDYNFPIVTNTATTTIQTLNAQDFEFGKYISVYPNPVKEVLNIETKQTIEVTSISIYNTLGQLVLVVPNAQDVKTVDVSSLTSGNYFIKVSSDKGTSNTKFIKE